MGGFSNAFWLWFPVLIFKAVSAFFRIAWKFNLWILQTISGVPLYYCRPEYRIPAIFCGTLGLMSTFNFIFIFLIIIPPSVNYVQAGRLPMGEFLTMGLMGGGLLLLCRYLIRRGSI